MSALYRCFFFDLDHKISGFRDIDASSDPEAIVAAKALSVDHHARAFELWRGMRHLHSESIGNTNNIRS